MCSLIILSNLTNAQDTSTQNQQKAQTIIKRFAKDLKTKLVSAMQAKGPIHALEVCHLQANPIAKKHAQDSDWNIRRTSIKVRNPNNAPDAWENIANIEYAETQMLNNQSTFRYIKVIPTSGVCLTCHGVNLDNALAEKIQQLYPNDQATKFNLGDIRGAFSLLKVNKSQ
jgi:hypothetical protein